jgi:hypothetical protein
VAMGELRLMRFKLSLPPPRSPPSLPPCSAGVGKSSGDYKEATISRWASDTRKLVQWLKNEHEQSKVILVGAGVGGWVMLHAAQGQQNPRRPIVGCVGVAADPDFTETLIWPALNDVIKATLMKEGVADIEWGGKPYTITKSLIEDGRKMMLLDKGTGSINLECPVRLIQVKGCASDDRGRLGTAAGEREGGMRGGGRKE